MCVCVVYAHAYVTLEKSAFLSKQHRRQTHSCDNMPAARKVFSFLFFFNEKIEIMYFAMITGLCTRAFVVYFFRFLFSVKILTIFT